MEHKRKEVDMAITLEENCCTNLRISLFWEEKLVMLLRVFQLYSFFFLVLFEYWPSAARQYMTPVFTMPLGAVHLWNQDQYYKMVQNISVVRYVTLAFLGVMVGLALIFWFLSSSNKIRFRVEYVWAKKFNWFKLIFWICEILYLPFLANIGFTGNCVFISERDAITPTTC